MKEKIFGIGLSRTGTTSLTSALEILGYKSIHYPEYYFNSLFELKINPEILQEFDAMTDVPVAFLFKELDDRFPNAKFILTIRDEDSWVKSASKFFTTPDGSSSKGWIIDFMKFLRPRRSYWRNKYLLRNFIYGSFKFNKQEYLNRYKKHNKEVISHFKNDPDKLLIIDLINESNKWDKLCNFLDKEVPKDPFPHINSSNINDSSSIKL
ncbi:hypothetical protein M0G43_06600 [Subsaxibacter sp. CAU 1640]|uniref:sulfotransferase family protein n=1 Tax=Subsaxibacter sp. CAU 1640 TaxID=2933271 RepID=UPI002003DD6D|nr:sulfotransferase family protein [Subsaxibacter sp. CAU 1640]MCK7590235.1 hypothetical protein [Subsaxibacter sp. CAU 1640]